MQTAQIPVSLQEGIAAAKAGNNVLARDMLRRAAEVHPNSEQTWFWLAYLAEDPDERHSHLRQIIRINPLHAQARSVLKKSLIQAGIDSDKNGDRERARKFFNESTELDPDCEQSWLWLASVSTSYKEVMDCLGRVLEINPNNEKARSWINRSAAVSKSSQSGRTCPLCGFSSAVKADRCFKCKAILTLSSLDAVLSNSEADRKMLVGAIERYKEIAAKAETPSVLYTLGLAYLNLNRIEDAVICLRRAKTIQPDNRLIERQLETLERRIIRPHRIEPAQHNRINHHVQPESEAAEPDKQNQESFVTQEITPDPVAAQPAPEPQVVEETTPRTLDVSDWFSQITPAASAGDSDAPAPVESASVAELSVTETAVSEPNADLKFEQSSAERAESRVEVEPAWTAPEPEPASRPSEGDAQTVRSSEKVQATPLSEKIEPKPQPEQVAAPVVQQPKPPVQKPLAQETQVRDRSVSAQPPVSRPATPGAQEPTPTRYAGVALSDDDSDSFESVPRKRPEVEAPLRAQVTLGTILVVDDSPTVRKIVAVTLEREGYRVLTAAGGMEALARINEAMPDLMLLDISMPHMDGYQLCKLMKANSLTKSVPVVMLSGKDGFFDKVRGKMSGATHYITKPFEPATLIEAVQKYCRRPAAA